MERAGTQITILIRLENADGAHAEKSLSQPYYAGNIPSADLKKFVEKEINSLEVGMTVLREQLKRLRAEQPAVRTNRRGRRAIAAVTKG